MSFVRMLEHLLVVSLEAMRHIMITESSVTTTHMKCMLIEFVE